MRTKLVFSVLLILCCFCASAASINGDFSHKKAASQQSDDHSLSIDIQRHPLTSQNQPVVSIDIPDALVAPSAIQHVVAVFVIISTIQLSGENDVSLPSQPAPAHDLIETQIATTITPNAP
jgi:hypothetical protein